MISGTGDMMFHALNRSLDELASFVVDTVRIGIPRSVLLVQPPSNRHAAARSMLDRVEMLNPAVEACRVAVQKATEALAMVERHQHDCRFALSPISAVPPEVMCRIFEHAVLEGRTPDGECVPKGSATVLARVCSLWRRLARGHRLLWDDLVIDERMPSEILDQYLQLSGGRPLRLTYDGFQGPPCVLENRDLSGKACVERLETLNWGTVRYLPVSLWETTSMPSLKVLKMHKPTACPLCEDEDRINAEFLDRTHFPQLKTLDLEWIELKYSIAFNAPNLRSLRLHGVTFAVSNFDALLEAVGTTLETISLSAIIGGSGFDDEDLEGTMMFELPLLHTMTLSNLNINFMRHILNWEDDRYPSLRIWNYTDSPNSDIVVHETALLLSRFSRYTHSITEINVTCEMRPLSDIIFGLEPWVEEDAEVGDDGATLNEHLEMLKMPRAPSLRTLRVKIAETSIFNSPHNKGDQMRMMKGVLDAVKRRHAQQYAPLELVEISTCVAMPRLMKELEGLVGKVEVKDCGNRGCRSRN